MLKNGTVIIKKKKKEYSRGSLLEGKKNAELWKMVLKCSHCLQETLHAILSWLDGQTALSHHRLNWKRVSKCESTGSSPAKH